MRRSRRRSSTTASTPSARPRHFWRAAACACDPLRSATARVVHDDGGGEGVRSPRRRATRAGPLGTGDRRLPRARGCRSTFGGAHAARRAPLWPAGRRGARRARAVASVDGHRIGTRAARSPAPPARRGERTRTRLERRGERRPARNRVRPHRRARIGPDPREPIGRRTSALAPRARRGACAHERAPRRCARRRSRRSGRYRTHRGRRGSRGTGTRLRRRHRGRRRSSR